MSKRDFIRNNRKELDAHIRKAMDKEDYVLNDNEREMWIMNDEFLYNWARREGVNV